MPASVIVGSIAEGHSLERVLKSWPQLTIEDVDGGIVVRFGRWRRDADLRFRRMSDLSELMAARLKVDENLPEEIAESASSGMDTMP